MCPGNYLVAGSDVAAQSSGESGHILLNPLRALGPFDLTVYCRKKTSWPTTCMFLLQRMKRLQTMARVSVSQEPLKSPLMISISKRYYEGLPCILGNPFHRSPRL